MIKINFIDYYNKLIQTVNDSNKYLLNLVKEDVVVFDDKKYNVCYKTLYFEEGKCVEINIYIDNGIRKM